MPESAPAPCPQCGRDHSVGDTCCPRDGARADPADVGLSTTIDRDAEAQAAEERRRHEADALLGMRIDKYDVEEVLGRGGMGAVYRARHVELGHELAIKVLDKSLWPSPDLSARFFQEAKAAARIGHPNIVQVFDFARHAVAGSYIVMELLKGDPLDRVIAREAPLPELRVIGLGLQLCDALGTAHKLGIVHRDLKPANVFVLPPSAASEPDLSSSSGGEMVKVMDFGVAKFSESQSAVETRPGTLVGTPLYMSPEQWESGPTDARTDVYSFGLLLYEMLTGKLPYAGTLMQLAQRLALETPKPPSAHRKDLTPAFDALVLKCIQKIPAARYQTMEEVAADLKRAREVRRSTLPPPGRLERRSLVTRGRLLAASGALALVALGVAARVLGGGGAASRANGGAAGAPDLGALASGPNASPSPSPSPPAAATTAGTVAPAATSPSTDGTHADESARSPGLGGAAARTLPVRRAVLGVTARDAGATLTAPPPPPASTAPPSKSLLFGE